MKIKICSVILAILLFIIGLFSACKNEVTNSSINNNSGSTDSSSFSSEYISISSSGIEENSELSSADPDPTSSADSDFQCSTPTVSITSSQVISSSQDVSNVSSSESSSSSSSSTISNKNYYLAGSWNGYLVDDELYQMMQIPGTQNWYTVTVELTPSNRDELYDGHWYKVTEGNWTYSYGIDNYVQQPAPVKKDGNGNPIGLGSVWVDENLTLTVIFDSANLVIYDNTNGKVLPAP